jgi:hypothetical protein
MWTDPEGRFTLWQKVEMPSISTNHIARNQEFGLSTLHTKAKVQSPSQFNIISFWRSYKLSKELRVGWEWQPNYGQDVVKFFAYGKSIIDKIMAVRLEGLFWARNKVGMLLWVWTLSLAFGSFTLCPTECSNSQISLAMYFQPVSLDSQQSLVTQSHPTASRLQRPQCEATLRIASHYGRPSQEALGLSGQTLLRVQRNELQIVKKT